MALQFLSPVITGKQRKYSHCLLILSSLFISVFFTSIISAQIYIDGQAKVNDEDGSFLESFTIAETDPQVTAATIEAKTPIVFSSGERLFTYELANYGNIDKASVFIAPNLDSAGNPDSYNSHFHANVLNNYGHINEFVGANSAVNIPSDFTWDSYQPLPMLANQGQASVGTVDITSGMVYNSQNATIDTANIKGYGSLENFGNATISVVFVEASGEAYSAEIRNGENAHIDEVNIDKRGLLRNGVSLNTGSLVYSDSTIDKVFVHGEGRVTNAGIIDQLYSDHDRGIGMVENGSAGTINTVTLEKYGFVANSGLIGNVTIADDASVWNYGGEIETASATEKGSVINRFGHIGTVTVDSDDVSLDGYNLYNDDTIARANISGKSVVQNYGTITEAFVDGGIITNEGSIEKMTYASTFDGSNMLTNQQKGHIGTVDITTGVLKNTQNATIGTVNINNGTVENIDNATITKAFVGGNGEGEPVIHNSGNARIGEVTVNAGGKLENGRIDVADSSTIDKVFVHRSGQVSNNAVIDQAHVNSSHSDLLQPQITNNSNGTINTATLENFGWVTNGGIIGDVSITDDGSLWNMGGEIETASATGKGSIFNRFGHIDTVSVDSDDVAIDGFNLNNGETIGKANIYGNSVVQNYGTIEEAFVDGGNITNDNRIENMTYVNGEFNGERGSIGTLTIASNNFEAGENWGTIENIAFAADGSGYLTIKGFVEEPSPEMGFRSMRMNTTATPTVTWGTGLEGININPENGNFIYDASDIVGMDSNSLISSLASDDFVSSIFNTDGVSKIFSIEFIPNETIANEELMGQNVMNFFVTEFIANGYQPSGAPTWDDANGGWVVTAPRAAVPEPATLVMLGLGLAGLGLARRRRK